ncbi:MAG: PIN domain nuclease [Pirellula sp.]|nr:PIN domain nuclease [Pirellula sp.]
MLVDANILIRTANPADSEHKTSIDALRQLAASGHELVLVPQVLYEYWVVATRPAANNGLGMTADEAAADLDKFCARFVVMLDVDSIFEAWRDLVSRYAIVGKKAHDARLVAAMVRHGITHLLTFNEQDFARISEIAVILPSSAATFPPATA